MKHCVSITHKVDAPLTLVPNILFLYPLKKSGSENKFTFSGGLKWNIELKWGNRYFDFFSFLVQFGLIFTPRSNESIKGAFLALKQIAMTTESPLKMMKNAFYFTLNALFVVKIFKVLY